MRHAIAEIHDVLELRIEMRPPKQGEIGWVVGVDATEEEAIHDVISGRDVDGSGAYGFGWLADDDNPEFDSNSRTGEIYGRNITVIVEPRAFKTVSVKVL